MSKPDSVGELLESAAELIREAERRSREKGDGWEGTADYYAAVSEIPGMAAYLETIVRNVLKQMGGRRKTVPKLVEVVAVETIAAAETLGRTANYLTVELDGLAQKGDAGGR